MTLTTTTGKNWLSDLLEHPILQTKLCVGVIGKHDSDLCTLSMVPATGLWGRYLLSLTIGVSVSYMIACCCGRNQSGGSSWICPLELVVWSFWFVFFSIYLLKEIYIIYKLLFLRWTVNSDKFYILFVCSTRSLQRVRNLKIGIGRWRSWKNWK